MTCILIKNFISSHFDYCEDIYSEIVNELYALKASHCVSHS